MYITVAVGDGRQLRTLRRRVHGAAQWREGETFQVSKESSAVCT